MDIYRFSKLGKVAKVVLTIPHSNAGEERVFSVIKTHDSESRGQEEAGRTRRTSELFTRSTALKFVNALNKPP